MTGGASASASSAAVREKDWADEGESPPNAGECARGVTPLPGVMLGVTGCELPRHEAVSDAFGVPMALMLPERPKTALPECGKRSLPEVALMP